MEPGPPCSLLELSSHRLHEGYRREQVFVHLTVALYNHLVALCDHLRVCLHGARQCRSNHPLQEARRV